MNRIVIKPIIEKGDQQYVSNGWIVEYEGSDKSFDTDALKKICEPIMEAHMQEKIAYWEYKKHENTNTLNYKKSKIITSLIGWGSIVLIASYFFQALIK